MDGEGDGDLLHVLLGLHVPLEPGITLEAS